MTAATPPQSAAPDGPTCSNCGAPSHEDDVFCESCGYDFASGSLPEGDVAVDPAAASASAEGASTGTPSLHVRISVDADFFAASVGDADLTLPDPAPPTEVVPMVGARLLIGRQSNSRGIFPEIDVRALTGDPAVSSRHAVLERGVDGTWSLTDLGSTNGTYLSIDVDSPVTPGEHVALSPGTTVFLGAWTRLDIAETLATSG